MHLRPTLVRLFLFAIVVVFCSATDARTAIGDEASAIPDFTQGDKPSEAHDWTLGPTGARGWIYTADGHSRKARQILVTTVATGSPADGVLRGNDVILGVGEQVFSDDARIQLARAIAMAESEAGDGKLRLLRWRDENTEVVELTLPVLGSYSSTAPYDCPKSRRIFDLGCASLARRMQSASYSQHANPITRSLNALALLASGKQEYMPLIRSEARWAADFKSDGYLSWYYGYILSFLGEYVIATGDRSVMPGLERLALETARGQSGVGTWGHRFARLGGNLEGYGCMNQPGLSLTIGMVIAREAGIKGPELDRAIAKSAAFLRWFVNKGAIPYGDHQPFFAHEDNGKCASAAVLFDLLGDREASEFFAKMSTAAYAERERGHTGNYFNILWALPGVARCGPQAIGAYMKQQAWYYDLARSWDTSYVYQGSPVGEEEHGKYAGWDCSGGYLLAYALPLKSLCLTGNKGFCVPPLHAEDTAEVIAAGRDFAYRGDTDRFEQRSTQELLLGLESWSPFVRGRSARALAKRDGDFVNVLLRLADSSRRDARYGALEAFATLGPRADAAAPLLRVALQDADIWTRCLAAEAIAYLGPEARKASVGDLLALTVRVDPGDPRRMAARSASVALFSPYPGRREPRSILAESLDGVDREQLIPAVRTLLKHEDSVVRGSLRKVYPHLTDSDLVELLPDITRAVERIAPSNEMFADGVVLAGLDLLSRLHVREGMELCVASIQPERWGEKNRAKDCLAYLRRYGAHAQPLLPKLRDIRNYLATIKKADRDHLKQFDEVITAIESDTAKPTLVNLKEFRSRQAVGS